MRSKILEWVRRETHKIILPFLEFYLHPTDERIHSSPFITGKFYPLGWSSADYVVPAPVGPLSPPPVPPPELWEGYAETLEQYLADARKDVATMLEILAKAGESAQTLPRVLDFGCAAARMLRFYPHNSSKPELWGVDINAKHILWCQQNLSPPLHFATTTTAPHLPFEDKYFDLVYCGSVFTHISDLADAWFLELRRILRNDGYAYITIHDKHTVDLLFTKYKEDKLFSDLVESVKKFDEKNSVRSQNYSAFSIGSDPWSQVFYDVDYLTGKWGRWAKVVSVNPEAHDHQTAILFQKVQA